MGKFTKNNFLNIFNKIKEFFRHRKHLRDISGMVDFDDALDFLEKMRAMKIKEPRITLMAMVSNDEQD
ncbi:hypothetical protein ECC11_02950 [Helicobacter pylori]|uniref:hypothetical protein n=1 Tax=Helicobacter pylori TaxID=210 RepID=UPI000FDDA923|nr:hypothetical protein [Helicobacter pylori]RVY23857.1 hypothetical protein ECC11_02950 [Helicobacter pylori]